MKRKDIDECKWHDLYYKYFDPHECWENGCCGTEDNVIYDENGEIVDVDVIFCCADGDDECKMYEKWIQSENESKRP